MSEDKKIEVVKGDGSNLDISPAYDHLNDVTPEPSSKKPKNIVVPKAMKDKKEKDEENNTFLKAKNSHK